MCLAHRHMVWPYKSIILKGFLFDHGQQANPWALDPFLKIKSVTKVLSFGKILSRLSGVEMWFQILV